MKHRYGVLRGRLDVRELALPADGRVSLIALADTHSRPHGEGLELVAATRPSLILHGGDIGDLAVLDTLEEIAPVIAVRGNIDSTTHDLPTTIILRWTLDGVVRSTWLLTHNCRSRSSPVSRNCGHRPTALSSAHYLRTLSRTVHWSR